MSVAWAGRKKAKKRERECMCLCAFVRACQREEYVQFRGITSMFFSSMLPKLLTLCTMALVLKDLSGEQNKYRKKRKRQGEKKKRKKEKERMRACDNEKRIPKH